MGVAKDADIWMFVLQERSSFFRQFPAFIQNMTDGDAEACQVDHGLGRKPALVTPFTLPETAGRLGTAMLWDNHELAKFGRTIN